MESGVAGRSGRGLRVDWYWVRVDKSDFRISSLFIHKEVLTEVLEEDLEGSPQVKRHSNQGTKARNVNMWRAWLARRAWGLDCNSLQRLWCTDFTLSLLWGQQLPYSHSPEALSGQAWKITHWFLTRGWIGILIFMKWYLTAVWICISLITINVEHLAFMCLLAI